MGLVEITEPVPVAELGRVHFAAIGGAGMSGIARILLARGVPVSGCDCADSAQLAELAGLGARVTIGHAAAHLDQADTLVVSTAIRPDNPELAAARQRGMPVLHRAGALASVMAGRTGVAVAGTHGKTTTTSMITSVLLTAGRRPSYVIGGVLGQTGVGAADGTDGVFVAEADESDGSFLHLAPDIAVVTCVEADHLDNYSDLGQIEDAFASFAARLTPGGLLVTSADDPGARRLARRCAALPVRQVSYGESGDASYRVSDVSPDGMAIRCTLTGPGSAPASVRLGVPGRHNTLNAAAAWAVAAELGIDAERIVAGLAGYRGARRRMEPKGGAGGVEVVDSYAHHPTEITADLRAARDIAGQGRVIVVFQPHLFSRTRLFARDFGAALGLADEVVVLDVYAAREDPEPGVTGALVAQAVPGGATFATDRAAVPALAAGLARPGDLVLTMGAGDVTTLGSLIVAALERRAGTLA